MRNSANNLLYILEEISDGFFTLDEKGRFTFISAGAEQLLATSQDMLGREFCDLFSDEQSAPLQKACQQALLGDATASVETCLTLQERWLEVHICPLPPVTSYEEDSLLRPTIAVVFHDIHVQKESSLREEREKIARHSAEQERRKLFSEMLGAVSGGKLHFCETAFDLPEPLPPWCDPMPLADSSALATLRQTVREAAQTCGFSRDRCHDLMAAVGEGAINALLYGDTAAYAEILVTPDRSRVQVWITDHGTGIPLNTLPHDTLARGQGFSIMIDCVDVLHLWTGEQGTTVVLEVTQDTILSY